jgi:hypothetical protein
MSNYSDSKDVGLDAKPLDDNDIDKLRKKIATLPDETLDVLNKMYNNYSQLISSLIVTILKQTKDEDDIVEVERVKRLISLAPADEIFFRSKDKVWAARSHIIAKNADWFLNRDYKHLIKKDSKQVMIETLVNFVKRLYKTISSEEKEKYWLIAAKLLNLVANFKKILNE